ncbi:unnamed protein product [Hydatigera taeniaeformis]|uniref:Phosphoribosyltransferase domain-containing protein n=1 Tax=Hydatigena taeniaeformis TaxID=6205 RepID=A0A3P7GZG2_HYDTA|nr:unnamed protein product [Hydatigera taeniaeformis]
MEPEPLTSPFVHNVLDFLPALQEKEKPPLNLVGNVNGKIAVIVDDIIDDVDDYVTAAELLHSRGAYKFFELLIDVCIFCYSFEETNSCHERSSNAVLLFIISNRPYCISILEFGRG